MHRRFVSILLPLALALPAGALALPVAKPVAVQKTEQANPSELQSLRIAELKLAALAKEAGVEGAPTPEVTKKSAEKKHPRVLKKKHRAKSAHGKAQVKGSNGKTLNVVSRRLTPAEVNGILTTSRDFSGSDLSGLNLVGMDLSGVKFNRANLKMANMERADLAETDLELADLTGANLRGASLNQARLRGTRMEGVRMDGALWVDRTLCKKGSLGSCIE